MSLLNCGTETSVKYGAADAGDRAGEHHVPEARRVDLDADGVGGLRVLADGAQAQAPARLEHPDPDERRRRTSGRR
jgi:hypothetical protein